MRSLGRLRIPLVVLAVVLSLSVVTSAGSLSFTADRQTGLNVVEDSRGIVGLDKTAEIQKGSQDTRLIAVNNPTTRTVDLVVQISGDDWSFSPGPNQTVTTSGGTNTLRTSITPRSTVEVRVNVENNAKKGERPYDITVERSDFDFEKTPTVDIVAGPPNNGGGCEASGNPNACK